MAPLLLAYALESLRVSSVGNKPRQGVAVVCAGRTCVACRLCLCRGRRVCARDAFASVSVRSVGSID
jgi:hypothetical protein